MRAANIFVFLYNYMVSQGVEQWLMTMSEVVTACGAIQKFGMLSSVNSQEFDNMSYFPHTERQSKSQKAT
jgi:hypothetical protein